MLARPVPIIAGTDGWGTLTLLVVALGILAAGRASTSTRSDSSALTRLAVDASGSVGGTVG